MSMSFFSVGVSVVIFDVDFTLKNKMNQTVLFYLIEVEGIQGAGSQIIT